MFDSKYLLSSAAINDEEQGPEYRQICDVPHGGGVAFLVFIFLVNYLYL
jgi:hypothetical protein